MLRKEKKIKEVAWKPNDEINVSRFAGQTLITMAASEAVIPVLLRIALCASVIVGGAQAQLRRARGAWRLSVPPLAMLQRLMMLLPVTIGIVSVVLDILSKDHLQVYMGKTIVTIAICGAEMLLVILSYCIGVWSAMRTKRLILMLQTIHKIESSLKRSGLPTQTRYSRVKHGILIFFIFWNLVCFIIGEYYTICAVENVSASSIMYTVVVIYMSLVVQFLQLQWSIVVDEINSTLTLVNDMLENLLKRSAIGPFNFKSLHNLNLNYDAICDMVRQIDSDDGPFMLSSCLLLFLYLLKTPYNFLIELGKKDPLAILQQGNWTLRHFCHFMMLVDPCHRLQEQNKRTGHLLADLASQLGRRRVDIEPLKPFLLQVELSNFTLGSSDVFTVGRPLVASVIGGVTTYLIIIFQFQNVSEVI